MSTCSSKYVQYLNCHFSIQHYPVHELLHHLVINTCITNTPMRARASVQRVWNWVHKGCAGFFKTYWALAEFDWSGFLQWSWTTILTLSNISHIVQTTEPFNSVILGDVSTDYRVATGFDIGTSLTKAKPTSSGSSAFGLPWRSTLADKQIPSASLSIWQKIPSRHLGARVDSLARRKGWTYRRSRLRPSGWPPPPPQLPLLLRARVCRRGQSSQPRAGETSWAWHGIQSWIQ